MSAYSAIRARLDVELRDSQNNAFSSAEKDEALDSAINDELAYINVEDSTVTSVFQQRSYALDTSYKALWNVAVDIAGDGFPSDIPMEGWEFKAPNLIIKRRYMNIPASKTFYIDAAKKLAKTDDIPQPIEEYVLELAIANCQEYLANIKINRFLKNDTTMGELMARINLANQRLTRMRHTLRNQRGVTL